jgi:hypothetical protein
MLHTRIPGPQSILFQNVCLIYIYMLKLNSNRAYRYRGEERGVRLYAGISTEMKHISKMPTAHVHMQATV